MNSLLKGVLLLLPICLLTIYLFSVSLRLPIEITQYNSGNYLYANRPYVDSNLTAFFNGFYLLKLERHQTGFIYISNSDTIIAYRFVPQKSNNNYLKSFHGMDLNVRVIGLSSTLDSVIFQKLNPGTNKILSGGDNEAWPIIINKIHSENVIRANYYKRYNLKNILWEISNLYESNKYPPFHQLRFYLVHFFKYYLAFIVLYSCYVYFIIKVCRYHKRR